MRVDLLLVDQKAYEFETFAAEKVSSYLKKSEIPHQRVYLNKGHLQDYLSYISHSPPTWTLSFVEHLPAERPFCDLLKIPHFFWSPSSLVGMIAYLSSSFGKIGISDAGVCRQLASKKCPFLVTGVDPTSSYEKKIFEVVYFGNLIDQLSQKKLYGTPPSLPSLIDAVEKGTRAGSIDPTLPTLLEASEEKTRAEKAYTFITHFSGAPLAIFGEHMGNNWTNHLPSTTSLHKKLVYSEHFEVLKQSKIIVVDQLDEWFYAALAAQCLPIVTEEDSEKLNKKILYYLAYPKEREAEIQKNQSKILDISWEKQTKRLIEIMQ